MHRATPRRAQPGFRPGERLVNGQPHIFSLDLLNDFLSGCVVEDAPDDLATLSWDELSVLLNAYLRLRLQRPDDPDVVAFGVRLGVERSRRREYAAYGRGVGR